jgi:hypothetical protein
VTVRLRWAVCAPGGAQQEVQERRYAQSQGRRHRFVPVLASQHELSFLHNEITHSPACLLLALYRYTQLMCVLLPRYPFLPFSLAEPVLKEVDGLKARMQEAEGKMKALEDQVSRVLPPRGRFLSQSAPRLCTLNPRFVQY